MFWYSRAYCFCLHCNNTKKTQRRNVKLDRISHRTQKWTGQNYWHLVKMLRYNCFSSMWCSCNLYLDTPVASNRCGQYSNHTCNQLKLRKVDSTFVLCVTRGMEKRKKCTCTPRCIPSNLWIKNITVSVLISSIKLMNGNGVKNCNKTKK